MNDCQVSEYIRNKYPVPGQMKFISASGDAISNNWTAYITELEKLCSSTSEPKFRKFRALQAKNVNNQLPIYIESLVFLPYDSTKVGGSGQNDSVTNAINASKSSMEAYALSQFKNAQLAVNHQPNFFNPIIKINGNNMCSEVSTHNENSIADRAIGFPIGWCFKIEKEFTNLQSIEIEAAYAQYISEQSLFLNYPLLALLSFRTGT